MCAAVHRRYLAFRGLLPPFCSYDRIGDSPVSDLFRYLLLFGLGFLATLFLPFPPIPLLLLSLVYAAAIGVGRMVIRRAAYPRPLPISTREMTWTVWWCRNRLLTSRSLSRPFFRHRHTSLVPRFSGYF